MSVSIITQHPPRRLRGQQEETMDQIIACACLMVGGYGIRMLQEVLRGNF